MHITFRNFSYHHNGPSSSRKPPNFYVSLTPALYSSLRHYHTLILERLQKLRKLHFVRKDKLINAEINTHIIADKLLGDLLANIAAGKYTWEPEG
jgi:hypothetical protein